jgi:hypothetical protein
VNLKGFSTNCGCNYTNCTYNDDGLEEDPLYHTLLFSFSAGMAGPETVSNKVFLLANMKALENTRCAGTF